jgi:hypothetical protein
VIIFTFVDRMGRDTKNLIEMRERVLKVGGDLVFSGGRRFEKNAQGKFSFVMEANVAEYYRGMTRENIMRGQRAKVGNGIQVSRSLRPLGYNIIKKADVIKGTHPPEMEGRYILADAAEVETVGLLFEKYVEFRSIRRVASWMNEAGHKPMRAASWKPNSIRATLMNPIYKGEPGWGKAERRTDEKRMERGQRISYNVARDKADWLPLTAPAIVSAALWDEANDLMTTGRATRSGPRALRYLLTGLMHCPQCGRRMYAAKRFSSGLNRPAPPEREHYFRCGAVYPYVPGSELRCDRSTYRGMALEWLTVGALRHLVSRPELITAAAQRYDQARAKDAQARGSQHEAAKLRKEIAQLHKREDTAAAAVLEARMAGSRGEAYERARRDAETKRTAAETRLAALESEAGKHTAEFALPPAAAELLAAALGDEGQEVEVTPELSDILHALIEAVYPLPWHGPNFKKLNIGGAAVVLKTSRPGAFYVLRHVIEKRGAQSRAVKCSVTLDIEAAPPFPFVENAVAHNGFRGE